MLGLQLIHVSKSAHGYFVGCIMQICSRRWADFGPTLAGCTLLTWTMWELFSSNIPENVSRMFDNDSVGEQLTSDNACRHQRSLSWFAYSALSDNRNKKKTWDQKRYWMKYKRFNQSDLNSDIDRQPYLIRSKQVNLTRLTQNGTFVGNVCEIIACHVFNIPFS